eukprot:1556173-Rhodomonas_salina.1
MSNRSTSARSTEIKPNFCQFGSQTLSHVQKFWDSQFANPSTGTKRELALARILHCFENFVPRNLICTACRKRKGFIGVKRYKRTGARGKKVKGSEVEKVFNVL